MPPHVHNPGMLLVRGSLAGLLLILAPAGLSAQSVHFVDVTVVPMDRETTLARQTVVVRGERIVSIGPTKDEPVPDDAIVINGAGLYLVPGLTDAHVHLAGTIFAPGRAEFGDAPLYLAYGVTTVFNLGGTTEHLEWRRRVIAGELIGPTIYTSPPFFNEPRVNSAEEVEREIAATAAADYDLLKFREIVGPNPAPTTVGLSLSAYETMNEAARRARLPLIGHAPVNLGLDAMLHARQQALAHVGELTRLYFNPVVRHRWSLIAGGAGLAIVLTVALVSEVMALVRRFRRLPRRGSRARLPVSVLAGAGLVAAASYFCFSPGGPFFRSTLLRIVFTVASLTIAASTIVLAWRRSLVLIPAGAVTYWAIVWTPIAWRSSQSGIDDVARRLKNAGTVVQSTLINYDTFSPTRRPAIARDPAIDYLQPSARDRWRRLPPNVTGIQELNRYPEFTREVTAALHRAGVPLMAGTDALGFPLIAPGSSLHGELELLHEAGLTPYEALRTATVVPAAFLGKAEEFGTIAVGQRADLMLVERNPLEDLGSLRQPVGVMVRGRWLGRDRLQAMLAALR
jgi:cytosine/adenosine deaminase-related metal-dependent hydrolase